MKNILGTTDHLELFHTNGEIAYDYFNDSDIWEESTFDRQGNYLAFKSSEGYSCEYTYDERCNMLTFNNSDGYWEEYTYDESDNQLTFKDSDGYWREYTYDEKGNLK